METNSLVIASPRLSDGALYGLFLSGQDSDDTRRLYDAGVRAFAGFLSRDCQHALSAAAVVALFRRIDGPAALTLVEGFRAWLVQADKSPSTVNARLSAVRAIIREARRHGLIEWKLKIENVRSEAYRDTRGPGRSGFEMIMDQIVGESPKAVRDRAIVSLLFYNGLRRSRVVELDLCDVNLSDRIIRVSRKGVDEKFPKHISQLVADFIAAWITVRGNEPGPLFVNLDHAQARGRLSGHAVWELVMRYGKQIGIRAWPHGLRHASITDLLDRSGGDLRMAQRFAEHASADVTLRYDDNRRDLVGDATELLSRPGLARLG